MFKIEKQIYLKLKKKTGTKKTNELDILNNESKFDET